jgi:hypothetical protein
MADPNVALTLTLASLQAFGKVVLQGGAGAVLQRVGLLAKPLQSVSCSELRHPLLGLEVGLRCDTAPTGNIEACRGHLDSVPSVLQRKLSNLSA